MAAALGVNRLSSPYMVADNHLIINRVVDREIKLQGVRGNPGVI
jgi:hypothetical protein